MDINIYILLALGINLFFAANLQKSIILRMIGRFLAGLIIALSIRFVVSSGLRNLLKGTPELKKEMSDRVQNKIREKSGLDNIFKEVEKAWK